MAYLLRHWVSNPEVPSCKPLGGSKVDSAGHQSEVDKVSTGNIWGLSGKKELSPRSCSVGLRQLNPIHKKRP